MNPNHSNQNGRERRVRQRISRDVGQPLHCAQSPLTRHFLIQWFGGARTGVEKGEDYRLTERHGRHWQESKTVSVLEGNGYGLRRVQHLRGDGEQRQAVYVQKRARNDSDTESILTLQDCRVHADPDQELQLNTRGSVSFVLELAHTWPRKTACGRGLETENAAYR